MAEAAFVARHVRESAALDRRRVRGQHWQPGGRRSARRGGGGAAPCALWYTSLVSAEKSLPALLAELRARGARSVEQLPLTTSRKRARVLAWSFHAPTTRRAAIRALVEEGHAEGGADGAGGARAGSDDGRWRRRESRARCEVGARRGDDAGDERGGRRVGAGESECPNE